jgi:chromosome segregation ATPase
MKYSELYIQFLENLVETKSCELQDTQDKLNDANMSVDGLFESVNKKDSEIARLNDEYNALAKEKHSIELERRELERSVETLRKYVNNKDDHIHEMEKTINAQNNRLLAFEDIIDAKNKELQDFKSDKNDENTRILEMQKIELERQRLADECYNLKVANGNFLKIIETQGNNRIELEERIKDLESMVANKDAVIEDSINNRLKVIAQLDKAEEMLKDLDVEIHRDPNGTTEYLLSEDYIPY